jgi:hypothetical protein
LSPESGKVLFCSKLAVGRAPRPWGRREVERSLNLLYIGLEREKRYFGLHRRKDELAIPFQKVLFLYR